MYVIRILYFFIALFLQLIIDFNIFNKYTKYLFFYCNATSKSL